MGFLDDDGIILTVGAPGSGKTTWAQSAATSQHLVLERDEFRRAMFGSQRGYFSNPMPLEQKSRVLSGAIQGAMKQWPYPKFILADTNQKSNIVFPVIQPFFKLGVPVRIVEFHQPLELLLERNAVREKEDYENGWVPEDVIREMHAFMCDPTQHWWKKYNWPVARFAEKELTDAARTT